MDIRARTCDGSMKIGVIELYSNGLEDAIKPFSMRTHERESYLNHASNVIKIIKQNTPNIEVHLVPNSMQGVLYLIDQGIKLVNISLNAFGTTWHEELSKNAFIVVAAGNDAEEGESHIARLEKACAVGAVDKLLKPKSYSSWGKGYVKTCAVTGLDYGTGILNGTSFAAPVVTGLLAQWYIWYYDLFGAYPSISETNNFIKINSHDVWEDGKDLRTGYGLLRLPQKFEASELIVKATEQYALKINHVEGETPVEKFVDLLVPPFIKDGRTFVGSRGIFEHQMLNVIWDHENRISKYVR